MAERLPLSYVLPLRWSDDEGWPELASYLRTLAEEVEEVLVIDGSPELLFARHRREIGSRCRHLAPDPELRFAMGKVNGVTTGVLAARQDRVVVADDDVRWDRPGLERLVALLEECELVRPQNYFDPMPWHAVLDTGRTLLNRVATGDPEFTSGDFPGTLGIRRDTFVAMGGYDGDVMFENLELMRTVSAAGGRVTTPLDLYVRRLPPTASHYLSQRVRQAYDDFGVPARMAAFLAIAPAAALALARRRFLASAAVAVASFVGVAEAGRRRAGGTDRFPAVASLLAPVWVAERAVSAWLAVATRIRRGGVTYSGEVLSKGANSRAEIEQRLGPARGARAARRLESDDLVRPVAERR